MTLTSSDQERPERDRTKKELAQSKVFVKKNVSWTSEDVQQLSELFTKNVSLKDMAKALARTASAVNKALDRYKIRTRRYTKDQHLDRFHMLDSSNLYIGGCGDSGSKPTKRISTHYDWVSLYEVVNFLKKNNFKIMRLPTEEPPHLNGRFSYRTYAFCVNSTPRTSLELLILANRLRQEKNLPTFRVYDITW